MDITATATSQNFSSLLPKSYTVNKKVRITNTGNNDVYFQYGTDAIVGVGDPLFAKNWNNFNLSGLSVICDGGTTTLSVIPV